MTVDDTRLLACPACRRRLRFEGRLAAHQLLHGTLRCRPCRREWPVTDGVPRLFEEGAVRGLERVMRTVYDTFAPLHDPAAQLLLPLLQWSSESALRDGYMRRLELQALRPRRRGQPLRILEVGVGAGANLPLIERDLPRAMPVEIWGMDLSEGMLRQCRRRLDSHEGRRVRLLLADAHALPFPDASFDRVFHVGGIAAFRDPRLALTEMARVARPGTPIVVVDEQLDSAREHGLYLRLMFRALTFYDGAPRCPRALLPADADAVIEEQISRFYYCLTYRRRRPTAVGGRRRQRGLARATL